jgi:putative membrane protein insertion efficiency factor
MASVTNITRFLMKLPIVVYQQICSPLLGDRCKYAPSCSRYAIEAIAQFGVVRGSILACWRLLRCNPWSHGGYDPVEAQRLFKRAPQTTVSNDA